MENGRRLCKPGRLQHDPPERRQRPVAPRQRVAQGVDQIAAERAADAAAVDEKDVAGEAFVEQVVEPDFAPFVDHHQRVGEVGRPEEPVDQRRLAGAEKAGHDVKRDRREVRSSLQSRLTAAECRPYRSQAASSERLSLRENEPALDRPPPPRRPARRLDFWRRGRDRHGDAWARGRPRPAVRSAALARRRRRGSRADPARPDAGPNLERLLADETLVKLFHFGRFDLAVLCHLRRHGRPRSIAPRSPPSSPAPTPTGTGSRT